MMTSFSNALLPGLTEPWNLEEYVGAAVGGYVMYLGLSMGVPKLDTEGAMQVFLVGGTTVGSYQVARYATRMIKGSYNP
jgi:hypothetical protein